MKRILSALLIVTICLSMLAMASCGGKTNMEKLVNALAKDKIPMNEITFSEKNGINYINSPNGTYHYEEGFHYIDYHKDFKQSYGYFADVVAKESLTIKGGKNYCVTNQVYDTSTYTITYYIDGNIMDIEVKYTANTGSYLGYFGWDRTTEYDFVLEDVDFDVWGEDGEITIEEIKDSVSAKENTTAPTDAVLTSVAANVTAILNGMSTIGNTYKFPMR